MQRSRAGLAWHVECPKGVPRAQEDSEGLRHLEGHPQQVPLSPASLSDVQGKWWLSPPTDCPASDVPAELRVAVAEAGPPLQNLPDW